MQKKNPNISKDNDLPNSNPYPNHQTYVKSSHMLPYMVACNVTPKNI